MAAIISVHIPRNAGKAIPIAPPPLPVRGTTTAHAIAAANRRSADCGTSALEAVAFTCCVGELARPAHGGRETGRPDRSEADPEPLDLRSRSRCDRERRVRGVH